MSTPVTINRLALISFVSGLLVVLISAMIVAIGMWWVAPAVDSLVVTIIDGVLLPLRNLCVFAAVITGILALRAIKDKGGSERGTFLAWAGIALGVGWVVFFLLIGLTFFLGLLSQ